MTSGLRRRVPRTIILGAVVAGLYLLGALSPLLRGDFGAALEMPGVSYDGPRLPLSAEEADISDRLRAHVAMLSETIGERNLAHPGALAASQSYLIDQWVSQGYTPRFQEYTVAGKAVRNIEVTLPGTDPHGGIFVIGAHYDSAIGASANDNGSGVAVLLELSRLMKDRPAGQTIRFVAFTNEEPPYFQTKDMGSLRYARECRAKGERITGMMALETLGYYSDQPDSQHYPFPLNHFYPDKGNFVAFVGNFPSRALVRSLVGQFREKASFPSEGAAVSEYVQGVGWSDHWSFWQEGYPAVMVTDTAPNRYPYYHRAGDTLDKIDFSSLARVTVGLSKLAF